MPSIDPQSRPRPPQTLVERLNGRAAGIRGRVLGSLGTQPLRVFRLRRGWTGGEPGRGQLSETGRVEMRCGVQASGQPTPPRVTLEGQYSRRMNGLVEQGMALVEMLDATYTEADLVDYGRTGAAEETLYEIQGDGRDGDAPDRPCRRFTVIGAPERDVYRFGWVLRLREQEASAPYGNAQLGPGGELP